MLVRITAYNILTGGTGRADPLIEVIAANRPHILILAEATDPDVVNRMAKRLQMTSITAPSPTSALAILTTGQITHSINHALLTPPTPSPATSPSTSHATSASTPLSPRALLQASLRFGPLTLPVFALHLTPGATHAAELHRLSEISTLLHLTAPLRANHTPHLLAGDFNANAPTQLIDLARCHPNTRQAAQANAAAGGLPPTSLDIPRQAIATLQHAGYLDTLHTVSPQAASTQSTFSTHHPGQRLDYIFTHSTKITQAHIEQDRLATYASDHYPTCAEIQLPDPPTTPP